METPSHNPYEAPRATVFDPLPEETTDRLIPGGRRVSAGHGATWITDAFSIFARQWGVWIGIGLIFIVGNIALNLIPFVGGIAAMLLTPIVLGGLMIGCVESERGGEIDFRHLSAGFERHAGQLMIIALLYFAGFIAVMIVLAVIGFSFAALFGLTALRGSDWGGAAVLPFVLLGLVGAALVIPIVMAYWFAPALVVHHNLNGVEAMKQSFTGCLRNIVPFLLFGIIGLVLMVVATLPLLLGWLVLVPVLIISIHTAYRDIFVAQS